MFLYVSTQVCVSVCACVCSEGLCVRACIYLYVCVSVGEHLHACDQQRQTPVYEQSLYV